MAPQAITEGWTLRDALWMTMFTITTVGYGEVHPLSESGRKFTMGLPVDSIGTADCAITELTAFDVQGDLNQIFAARRMVQRITNLKEHFIICGGGHIGWHIAYRRRVSPPRCAVRSH